MSLVNFTTRNPFLTVGEGQDGADVTVPSYARTIEEALDDIRTDADFHGASVQIDVVAFGTRSKLLLARYDDCPIPTVLLFAEEDVLVGEAGTRFEDELEWDR